MHKDVERTPGVLWDAGRGAFTFRVQTHERGHQQTKRGVLEAVSSIYDPMGFLQSPLTTRCRMLVQELVRRGSQLG